METVTALHTTLSNATALTALLATYDSGPAIFTSRPVPRDAALPYVAISQVSAGEFDNISRQGRTFLIDVFAFADNAGSSDDIDAIQKQIYLALDRARIEISGWSHVLSTVIDTGPVPTDDSLLGRVVTVRVIAQLG